MAVRHKTGLDYFPFDVDFFADEKLEFVSARFGLKGEIIAIKLLCKIYRNGYYTEWTDDEAIIFAKRVGDSVTAALANDVVDELVKRDFFDKGIFNSFNILTSRGIQSRYLEAVERRKDVQVLSHLLLIDVSKFHNVNILKQDANISPKNADGDQQSKVKESKGNKSKLIGPVGLVGADAPTPAQLRKEYEELLEAHKGKTYQEWWNSLKTFVSEKRPPFIEPYICLWNLFAKTYRLKEAMLTEKRVKKFQVRHREAAFDFVKILGKIKESSFARGDNNRNWRVDFAFIIESEENYVKILEEKYD